MWFAWNCLKPNIEWEIPYDNTDFFCHGYDTFSITAEMESFIQTLSKQKLHKNYNFTDCMQNVAKLLEESSLKS